MKIDTRYRTLAGEFLDMLDVGPMFLEPGDTLMLSSDGVSDALEQRQVAEFLAYPDCQVAADALVNGALKAGASDNLTLVVLRLPGGIVAPPPKAYAGPAKKRSALPIVLGVLALLVIVGGGLAFALTRGQAPAAAATPTIESAVAGVTEVVARATRPTADLAGGGVQVATVAPGRNNRRLGRLRPRCRW